MSTIHEKLEQLNKLYQRRVDYNQELEKEILNYTDRKKQRDELDSDLWEKRIGRFGIALFLLDFLFSIAVTEPIALFLGWKNIEAMTLSMISIGIFFPTCAILGGATYLLEKKGLLEKIARKFTPKKYKELDQLSQELEKVNVEELKQQLSVSKKIETKYFYALETFQREAEKLGNIPSEEQLNLEYQRQLEKRSVQREEFFSNHVLTEEESHLLESVIEQEDIGCQKKIGEK